LLGKPRGYDAKIKLSIILTINSVVSGSVLPREVVCDGTFDTLSATDYVAAINPGWNLGNTLDATPNEDSWNNVPVVQSVFDEVAKAGFMSIRIPGRAD
jgi:endoglucanase